MTGIKRDASKIVTAFLLAALCLCWGSRGYSQQQAADVSAEATIKTQTIFLIDATDAGWELSGSETIDIGNVDALGTAISGAPTGDPDVNGIVGIPVQAGGFPQASRHSIGNIGAFYPFFTGRGGQSDYRHPHAALSIFLLTFGRWRILTSAQLLTTTTNVTVDQLKWKLDDTPGQGFRNYTGFSTSQQAVASGFGAWGFLYLDYGLLVEHEDEPGANTWLVTYTLIVE